MDPALETPGTAPPNSSAQQTFKYSKRLIVALYLAFLCWQLAATFSGNVTLPWYSSGDEIVIAGEVIRFSNSDFHQHFYDMPGTPLMLFGAAQWTIFRWWSVYNGHFHGTTNQFSFQHLQELLELLRIDNIIFYLLSGLLVFWLTSLITNEFAGAAAATLLLMNPVYAGMAGFLRVEPLAVCFLLAAILVMTESPWSSAPFWAGLLGGIGVACRIHSVTATLPILLLILLKTSWRNPKGYTFLFRCLAASVGTFLLAAAAFLFYFFAGSSSPFRTQYPLAFSLLAKASLGLFVLTLVMFLLYFHPRSRGVVVRTVTQQLFSLLGGLVVGFSVGTPTIFTEYGALLRSMNFYASAYKDPVAIHVPLGEKIVSYITFYFHVIASDTFNVVLLVMGVFLTIGLARWHSLWPYLAAAISFFFSKPLDLVRAPHHVAVWIPFYAIISAVPIAAMCGWLERPAFVWRWSSAVVGISMLAIIFSSSKHRAEDVAALAAGHRQRINNLEQARVWIRANSEKGATLMLSSSCFGPEIFYGWFRELGLDAPTTTSEERDYVLWWGNRSSLKGRAGYVCMMLADLPFFKQWELRQSGEGIDPRHDDRFQLVQSFGQGTYQLLLFRFDMRNAGDVPPPGTTFSMRSALRLDTVTPGDKSSIEGQSPRLITSPSEPWSWAAFIPLNLDPAVGGRAWVHLRGRAVSGLPSVGILDRATNTVLNQQILTPSAQMLDIYVNIPSEGRPDGVLILNAATNRRSQLAVEDTEVLARAHRVNDVSRMDEIELAYNKASIARNPDLTITTAPEKWTFAAVVPIHDPPNTPRLVLKIRALVLNGEVSFSFLTRKTNAIELEQSYRASQVPVEVFVPVPQSEGPGRLLIRDTAPNGTLSRVMLKSIETWQIE